MSKQAYNPGTDPMMLDLFRQEVESHAKTLTSGLLQLEKTPDDTSTTESLMRAAHSIKGAARMVGIDDVVKIAHIMEDCFVATQKGSITLNASHIDVFLTSVDTINDIAENRIENITEASINGLCKTLEKIKNGEVVDSPATTNGVIEATAPTDTSMVDLFRNDALEILSKMENSLGSASSSGYDAEQTESLISSFHEIKGGAKLAGCNQLVQVCSDIDGYMQNNITSDKTLPADSAVTLVSIIPILKELLKKVSAIDENSIGKITAKLKSLSAQAATTTNPETDNIDTATTDERPAAAPVEQDLSIRISTQRLNKLVGLAGESVIEIRWIRSHADAMLLYKRKQTEIISALDTLRNHIDNLQSNDLINELLNDVQRKTNDARSYLASRLSELEDYDRRVTGLSERLNHEVLQTRMRPFGDCTHGFDRMVRDIARSLDKNIELVIIGKNTQVDREILARIEAPLNHIIRNAIDHGIETASERRTAGKSDTATIRIEAAHNMGMLSIIISDDGRGVDIEALRTRIVEQGHVTAEMAAGLTNNELLDFLYLPGFTTCSTVTEISGRGVGLDVVHSTIHEMRGQIRTTTDPGKGMRIQLLLPLTLSVIRSLLVKIAGQSYAFPLARIDSITTLAPDQIKPLEGKQFFTHNDRHIGLIEASQVLEVSGSNNTHDEFPVIVLGDRTSIYGVVVDRFLGERDIAVHILDPRLGKIRDISAATLLENGEPAFIIDVDDMIRTIDILISGERIKKVKTDSHRISKQAIKRILVVDDSITVREVERKLLESRGYTVDVAVDGMDGWNTVNYTEYDLVISDVDMPRMNGIEFVTMIKNDPHLRKIPVMIVSYKDRQEDRDAGMQAGADYYLTKGSFHDESLVDAVIDLIGTAE